MDTFNTLLSLSELKEHYSNTPVGICPLYKGSIGATKRYEVTGNPVIIPAYVSLEKLNIKFSPKQAGSGDPSPDNVRPITGWDSVKVTVSNYDKSHDYDIILPDIIYGGTLDAVTGEGSEETLFLELAVADMNNSDSFPGWTHVAYLDKCVGNNWNSLLTDEQFELSNITSNSRGIGINTTSPTNHILMLQRNVFGLTQSQWKEQYPDLVIQICLKLTSPEPFKVSQISIPSLGSANTFFTNGENLDIIYKASSFWG